MKYQSHMEQLFLNEGFEWKNTECFNYDHFILEDWWSENIS